MLKKKSVLDFGYSGGTVLLIVLAFDILIGSLKSGTNYILIFIVFGFIGYFSKAFKDKSGKV